MAIFRIPTLPRPGACLTLRPIDILQFKLPHILNPWQVRQEQITAHDHYLRLHIQVPLRSTVMPFVRLFFLKGCICHTDLILTAVDNRSRLRRGSDKCEFPGFIIISDLVMTMFRPFKTPIRPIQSVSTSANSLNHLP